MNEKEFFKSNVLLPTIEQAENVIRMSSFVDDIYGIGQSRDQKNVLKIYEELIQFRDEFDNLTIKQSHERFKEIIRRNAPEKHKIRCSTIYARWKKILRRMGRFGGNPNGNKDKRP